MNKEQHILCKIAEEASEIAQIALKSAIFGLSDIYPTIGKSNYELLIGEFNDLLGVMEMLHELNDYKEFNYIDPKAIEAKKIKVDLWMHYSIAKGKTKENNNEII
jgi:hypothetical protein